jgi:hypothetical protein
MGGHNKKRSVRHAYSMKRAKVDLTRRKMNKKKKMVKKSEERLMFVRCGRGKEAKE